MILRIHSILALILFFFSAESQKISKSDKAILANLQTYSQALTGDGGFIFVISTLNNVGVKPKGDNNGWLQKWTVDEGRKPTDDAVFSVDGQKLILFRDWFPLTICPAGELTGSPAMALQESGVPWFQDLKEMLEAGSSGAHFDLMGAIRTKAAACKKKGATALILFNSSTRSPDRLSFDPKEKLQAAEIPVIYITREAKRKYLKDESASVDLHIRIGYTNQIISGENAIGYIDNGATNTIAITTNLENSSGGAVLLELARLLATSKLHNNNYLFVIYPVSDSTWLGAGVYVTRPVVDLRKINYLLSIGPIGSFNETTRSLTVGGNATSPIWSEISATIRDKKPFVFRYDSSASVGAQAIFYKQHIPFLAFSTDPDRPDRPDHPDRPVNYPGELQVLRYIFSTIESANGRGKIDFAP